MAFKTFTAGSVLTAADLNDYLMEQAVIVCTSGTRPTGQDGMRIKETDTGRELMHDGTNWVIMSEPTQTVASPTVTNLTVGNGTCTITYKRSDGWCDLLFNFVLGSTSAVGTGPTFTLPVAILAAGEIDVAQVTLYDASAVVRKHGTLKPNSTTVIGIQVSDTSTATEGDSSITATVPFTWATSDAIYAFARFRMTTRYS